MKKNITKITATLLLFVLATPFAFADTWDGLATSWTHGSGTESDPYLIESAANLAYLAEMVTNGTSTYSGQYFKMTTDIDLDSIPWPGIGISAMSKSFQGVFDGGNHWVKNINASLESNGALFVSVCNSTIKNLSTSGTACYGGIARHAYEGSFFINCHNYVDVTSKSSAGGVVCCSRENSSVTITNCSNSGVITITRDSWNGAGGIIGKVFGSCTIRDSYNTNNISANINVSSISNGVYVCAGGIVGLVCGPSPITVDRCYNSWVAITANFTDSLVYDSTYAKGRYMRACAGGLIGACVDTNAVCAITLCFNRANIEANCSTVVRNSNSSTTYAPTARSYAFAAGIIGYSNASNTIIKNCYNRSWVTTRASAESFSGTSSTTNTAKQFGCADAAGIARVERNSTISNCYNTAGLSANGSNHSERLGIGTGSTNGSSTITNCYYLETCNGTGEGTSMSEVNMKSLAMPVLLNATEDVYAMDVTPSHNNGYPIFAMLYDVLTNDASDIEATSAMLNGNYTARSYWDNGPADRLGFVYRKSSESQGDTVYTDIDNPFECQITGLVPTVEYTCRAFVTKGGITFYGEEKTFTTQGLGIKSVTGDNIKIYTRGNTIVIDFSGQHAADSRQSVVVYDVMGRVIKQAAGGGQWAMVEIPVSGTGVYMVKVGEMKPQKVVVRR